MNVVDREFSSYRSTLFKWPCPCGAEVGLAISWESAAYERDNIYVDRLADVLDGHESNLCDECNRRHEREKQDWFKQQVDEELRKAAEGQRYRVYADWAATEGVPESPFPDSKKEQESWNDFWKRQAAARAKERKGE